MDNVQKCYVSFDVKIRMAETDTFPRISYQDTPCIDAISFFNSLLSDTATNGDYNISGLEIRNEGCSNLAVGIDFARKINTLAKSLNSDFEKKHHRLCLGTLKKVGEAITSPR